MVAVCLYFQLHQPYRLKPFRFRDVGRRTDYFDDDLNQRLFLRVAEKCYWPSGQLVLRLLRESPEFRVTFSLSGSWLSQCRAYAPALLDMYSEILSHPHTELLAETSHHTLAALADEEEFLEEVALHRNTLQNLFGRWPRGFRNTELIYSDRIGELAARAGFTFCLLEGWEPALPEGETPFQAFCHPSFPHLGLLPRAYRRSDDVAFRFSNRSWCHWPLMAETYQDWILEGDARGDKFVGLFMDFETLGEHQWVETGILEFLQSWVRKACGHPRTRFVLPGDYWSEVATGPCFPVRQPLSWADRERDVSAWMGSDFQREALLSAFELGPLVKARGNERLLETWRRLLASDHFYYMCQKCASDGEVHGYFSPFSSPHDAYFDFRNIISDLEFRLQRGGAQNGFP